MDFLKKKFKIKNGIFIFDILDPKTKKVTEFYKTSPFPNYKHNDNKRSIIEKGNKNLLANQFKKFIGFKKNVLEVGCGTGQLSIYFSIGTNNNIVGLDPTIESLNLAKTFANNNGINKLFFVRADIFDDVLSENFFDFIWCSGVLHHTKDPYKAFKIIINSLKPEGYILIGLYNKYSRIRTFIRKYIYKYFGEGVIKKIDPTLKNLKFGSAEKIAWIRDQYMHPLETSHTLDEILFWFRENKIEFISSIPSSDFDFDYKDIFKKKSKGSVYSRLINQFLMIFNSSGSDGGLFIVIGKKVS
jgi:SAM-dependent methyltransferase